ncbi:MAG: peptidylprolyl isomerase [Gammaproteobacteria bacterium]|nr:peptidylprolyl isomerase [Gammaproteobacteria bacterium]
MKPLKHLTAILLSASLISIPAVQAGDVIAIIDGKPIDNETFSSYAMMRTQQVQHNGALTNEQRNMLLQEYINSELLYNAAINEGIDQLPAVKAEIKMQTRTLIINSALKKHMDSTFTEALLTEAYNEQYGKSSNEYHIRHILVEHETEANNIIAALKRGEDFKKLAGISSIDPSSSDGGSLGWMGTNLMPAEFAAVVTTLKQGEYASTPVKSNFGWHIIQLDEQRTIAPPPIEAVANNLASSIQNKIIKEYVDSLRNKAKIEIK